MTSDSMSNGGSISDISSSMADLKNSFDGMKSKSVRHTMTTPNMSQMMSPMSPQMNPMSMGMSQMSSQMNPMTQMASLLGQPSQGPTLDGISQQESTLDGNIEKSLNPELSTQLENFLEGGNNSSTSLDLSHASESLNGGSIRQMNTNSHVAPQPQPQQSMGSNTLESFILNNVPQGYSGEVHPMLANSLPMPSGGIPMMMSQPSMSFDLNSNNLPLDVQHALGHNNQGANLPMSEYAMPGMFGGKKHKKRKTKKN